MTATAMERPVLDPMPESLRALQGRLETLVELGSYAEDGSSVKPPSQASLDAVGITDMPARDSLEKWATIYGRTLAEFRELADEMTREWESLTGADVQNIEEALDLAERGLRAWAQSA